MLWPSTAVKKCEKKFSRGMEQTLPTSTEGRGKEIQSRMCGEDATAVDVFAILRTGCTFVKQSFLSVKFKSWCLLWTIILLVTLSF